MTNLETWMPQARQLAAQCWCDKETQNTEMDTVLAEAFARRIAAWMHTAARSQGDADYYRSLVIRCGNALGDAAKTCDDGTKSQDVLCAKVPDLVESLAKNHHDYLQGLKEGISRFAWWKNGTQYVGSCGTKLKDALKEIDQL